MRARGKRERTDGAGATEADARNAAHAARAADADRRELAADARGATADVREAVADQRDVDADARGATADAREADADARELAADARGVAADTRDADADERERVAEAGLTEAKRHLKLAQEHLVSASTHMAHADHRAEDAEQMMHEADKQLVIAAAKLAEAKSDSEEYQRALYHYTQLVRHRMANPLHVISGMARTLASRPDLPREQRLEMVDAILKQALVLEKVCLDPAIVDASELQLDPAPSRAARTRAN